MDEASFKLGKATVKFGKVNKQTSIYVYISGMTDTAETILLIDDDTQLTGLLSQYLGNEGFTVDCVNSGEMALEYLAKPHHVDIAVLDIMMPGMTGLEVLQQLRPQNTLPVIMLTGRGDDIDRIVGLEMGADDYMAKPCNPRELVARLRAILRRAAPTATAAPSEGPLQFEGLALDTGKLNASFNGQTIDFTTAEFNTLKLLLEHCGQSLSKAEMTEKVLHRSLEKYDRSIDVHVSRVRKKLISVGARDAIKSIRGYGYQLVTNDS